MPYSSPAQQEIPNAETIRCTLTRPLFSADGVKEGGGAFSVWAAQASDGREIRATAPMPADAWGNPGDEVEIEGEWAEHPRYGQQIKALSVRPWIPRDAAGVARWLEQQPGVGPVTAAKALRELGLPGPEALQNIWKDPSCLDPLGLSENRRAALVDAARAYFAEGIRAEVLSWCYQHGLGPARAAAVWAAYNGKAPAKVAADPWGSLAALEGFGFATADEVARRLGVDPAAESRMAAAVLYTLEEAAYGEGHVFLPRLELEKRVMLLLASIAKSTGYGRGRSADCRIALSAAIDALVARGEVIECPISGDGQGTAVYIAGLYYSEEDVREWLKARNLSRPA